MVKPSMQVIIKDIGFERNHALLFEKINYSLNAGELLQIRGANGSGKSTLLRILAGLIEPQQGAVLWQNQPISTYYDEYKQKLYYLGHQNTTKRNLSVYENLRLNTLLRGQQLNETDLKNALTKIGLSHLMHTQAQHLSAGQTRRLSLATLVLTSAPLWLLDEPMTALDSDGQDLLVSLLNNHLSLGGIAIIATHHDLPFTQNMQTLYLRGQYD